MVTEQQQADDAQADAPFVGGVAGEKRHAAHCMEPFCTGSCSAQTSERDALPLDDRALVPAVERLIAMQEGEDEEEPGYSRLVADLDPAHSRFMPLDEFNARIARQALNLPDPMGPFRVEPRPVTRYTFDGPGPDGEVP